MQPAPGLPKARRVAVRSSARSSCSMAAGAGWGTEDTGTQGAGDRAESGPSSSSPLTLPKQLSAAGEAHALHGLRAPSGSQRPDVLPPGPPPAGAGGGVRAGCNQAGQAFLVSHPLEGQAGWPQPWGRRAELSGRGQTWRRCPPVCPQFLRLDPLGICPGSVGPDLPALRFSEPCQGLGPGSSHPAIPRTVQGRLRSLGCRSQA